MTDEQLKTLVECEQRSKSNTHRLDKLEEQWEVLNKLAALGAKRVVLTGICFEEGKTGFVGMDTATGEFFTNGHEKISASYHGTGDIFSSTAVGALMRGKTLPDALAIAGDYTKECIRVTVENGKQDHYGVDFEQVIPYLVKLINE